VLLRMIVLDLNHFFICALLKVLDQIFFNLFVMKSYNTKLLMHLYLIG
jgi:hypothetical protein